MFSKAKPKYSSKILRKLNLIAAKMKKNSRTRCSPLWLQLDGSQ